MSFRTTTSEYIVKHDSRGMSSKTYNQIELVSQFPDAIYIENMCEFVGIAIYNYIKTPELAAKI